MSTQEIGTFARKHRVALLLAALALVLRLLLLSSRSRWFDEAATLYLARLPLAHVVPAVSALEENPPLHYLLAHLWMFLFSDPVFGLRLFAALCGAAAVLVFTLFCEEAAPEQALFAGSLAAASSFWVHFSQDGRLYSLLLLLSLAASVLLFELARRWKTAPALAYAALAVAGLYTHNFFVFVLLAHVVYLALSHRRRWGELRAWLVLYAATAVLYAPWLLHLRAQIHLLSRASLLQEPLTLRQLGFVTGTMLFDTSFLSFLHEPWTLAIGAAGLALALAGAYGLRDRFKTQDPAVFCLVQWAVPLAGLRLAELLLRHSLTQARYLIFVSPFFYLWLALAASRLGRRVGIACQAGLAVLMLAGTTAYFAGGRTMDPHLSGLAERIRQDPDRRDPVVYLDPFFYLSMRHYYLPERPHYLVGPRANIANWEAMPGYAPYLPDHDLVHLKRCVVVDPRHQLLTRAVGVASGKQVSQSLPRPGGPR